MRGPIRIIVTRGLGRERVGQQLADLATGDQAARSVDALDGLAGRVFQRSWNQTH